MDLHTVLLPPDPLPMPAARKNNFWYVRTKSDVVVVFLHGIFSDSRSCWLYTGPRAANPVFWPDLVRSDNRLGEPSIYLAGYYTAPDAGDFSLSQCAREVREALQAPDQHGNPQVLASPVLVFVCHSTGGIVARYLLERHKELFRDKQVGLLLIASPSLGSVWANVSSLAAFYYNQRLGLQLRWGGESLEDLHGRFKDLVDNKDTEMPGLFGMEAAETKMIFRESIPGAIRRLLPNRMKVVKTLSAGQYFGEVKQLRDTDHFSTVKPFDYDHPSHEFLFTFMQKFMDRVSKRRVLEPRPDGPPSGLGTPAVGVPSETGVPSGGGGNAATIGSSSVLPPPSATQVTQVYVSLSPPPSLGSAGPSPFGQGGVPLQWAVAGPSHAALVHEAAPKPRIDDLFEVITDPDEVPKALFGTDDGPKLAPYDVEYVNARIGVPDIQEALTKALLKNKGRLMVSGLRGIGKTREVAELARADCAAGWTILIARNEANGRLGLPAELPRTLVDARVMLIFDDLYTRLIPGSDQQAPYVERLDALLDWFEQRLPGSLQVIAVAHDEPRFQERLGLLPDAKRWRSFNVFRLPTISDDGLRQILTSLAAKANVAVAPDEVPKLIENSDRKPETLFINVDIARHNRAPLDQRTWKPTEGQSWRLRFFRAHAEYEGVDRVGQILHLLNKAGLPARVPYVTFIARELGETEGEAAINALVGEGLLGVRQDALTPFSGDQVEELIGEQDMPAIGFLASVDVIERAITDTANQPAQRVDDLLALSHGIVQAGDLKRAERTAALAIELGGGGARPYRFRAGIRSHRRDFTGVEADLTAAIEMDDSDADTRFVRGSVRSLLANASGALEDFDAAAKLGRDDGPLHLQRGATYYLLHQWREAEAELSAAIDRGQTEGFIFFNRGTARFQLQDAAGAEQDFSAALERGANFEQIGRQLHALATPAAPWPEEDPNSKPAAGNPFIYAMRGIARFRLGKHQEAEEDLTAAIDGGAGGQVKAIAEMMPGASLPVLVHAKKQLEAVPALFGEGVFYHLRALARLNQGRGGEAESDFDRAISSGFDDPEAYFGRGWARLGLEKAAEAERDASTAIEKGKQDGPTYALRGLARLVLKNVTEAEPDLTKAVELGVSNASILTSRGAARHQLGRLAEAEADLEAALSFGPGARALFLRGCVRFDLERYPEAEQDLTAAVELGFNEAAAFTLRGLAHMLQGNMAGAEADAAAGFERGADDALAYSLRAGVRLGQERYKEAEEDFTAAAALGRNDVWLLFNRARSRQALQRYAEAEQDCDAILAMGYSDGDVLVLRGQARLVQDKSVEAVEDLVAGIRAGRDDGLTHFLLARAYQAQTRFDEAEPEFNLAVERDSRPAFRLGRALLRLVRGEFRRAEEDDLGDIVASDPSDAQILRMRGQARFGQGKVGAALEDFDAALALSPNDPEFLGSRIFANLRLGNIDKAEQDRAQLEAMDPNANDTLAAVGALKLVRGDAAGAATCFTAAAAAGGGWYFWLGLAHLMAGRPDEARQAYSNATADALPGDILMAINELDWQTREREGVNISQQVSATAALIRADLEQTVGSGIVQ